MVAGFAVVAERKARPSGYEPEGHTLSLDDSIALTVRRPPKTSLEKGILDASWTLQFPRD